MPRRGIPESMIFEMFEKSPCSHALGRVPIQNVNEVFQMLLKARNYTLQEL